MGHHARATQCPSLSCAMKLRQCSIWSGLLKRWLMIEKHPEPEHVLNHLSWWGTIWPISPRQWSCEMPSWQPGEPCPRRRGECQQGSRARWARRWPPWKLSMSFAFDHGECWPLQGQRLNHLLALMVWNKHQVMGQKGHQHRACIALTTWSPTPNMPRWHG